MTRMNLIELTSSGWQVAYNLNAGLQKGKAPTWLVLLSQEAETLLHKVHLVPGGREPFHEDPLHDGVKCLKLLFRLN